MTAAFTPVQQKYIKDLFQGVPFFMPTGTPGTSTPAVQTSVSPYLPHEDLGYQVQKKILEKGGRLSKEELIKYENNIHHPWKKIQELARENKLPEGEDIFLLKFLGVFNVQPADDGLMIRLRIPGGRLKATSLMQLAEISTLYSDGVIQLTTRSNIQIRKIQPKNLPEVLIRIGEAGLTSKGSGADSIRNIVGNATAGIDTKEIIDVYPLCREIHYHILNTPNLHGLPRKFNIALNGGGSVSALEDTNDIGLQAVRIKSNSPNGEQVETVVFHLLLGGISGHGDLAKPTGIAVPEEEVIDLIEAIIRVFLEEGDRTKRNKARLKYVLDKLGVRAFLEKVHKYFNKNWIVLDPQLRPAQSQTKNCHLGAHPQKQEGFFYLGVDIPLGMLSSEKAKHLAITSQKFGDGEIRLTPFQNFILSGVSEINLRSSIRYIEEKGIALSQRGLSAGMVACTGKEACKFGLASTKKMGFKLLDELKDSWISPEPLNINITGCPHSCAQHLIGDIGLLSTNYEENGETKDAFHIYLGGGFAENGVIGKLFLKDVPEFLVGQVLGKMIEVYEQNKGYKTFHEFLMQESETQFQRFHLAVQPLFNTKQENVYDTTHT